MQDHATGVHGGLLAVGLEAVYQLGKSGHFQFQIAGGVVFQLGDGGLAIFVYYMVGAFRLFRGEGQLARVGDFHSKF